MSIKYPSSLFYSDDECELYHSDSCKTALSAAITAYDLDRDSLVFLGDGSFGYAFGVNDSTVLKITTSSVEADTIRTLSKRGILSRSGFARIQMDRFLEVTYRNYSCFAYLVERVATYDVLRKLKYGDLDRLRRIVQAAEEIQRTATNVYDDILDKRPFDVAAILSEELAKLDSASILEVASFKNAILDAVRCGVFVTDCHDENMGFRIDDNIAELVVFDLMAKVYDPSGIIDSRIYSSYSS